MPRRYRAGVVPTVPTGLRVITGPNGSGKTERLLDRTVEQYQAHPLGPVLVLVPTIRHGDQFRRRLVARTGAAFGLEVATIAQWSRAHIQATVPPRGVLAALLERATDEVLGTPAGAAFAPLAGTPGLRSLVGSAVQDLLADGVTPDAFATAAPSPRLAALAAILLGYVDELTARGWVHPAALPATAAAEVLPETIPTLVLVDGFRVLRRGELALLASLARHAEVVLAFDPAGERATADLDALRALSDVTVEALDTPRTAIERYAASAPDREAMLRGVAREVKQLLIDHPELRPSDCAIAVRQVAPYLGLARDVFEEYDLPLDPAAGVRLAERPLGVWLRRLLHLADPASNEPDDDGWRLRDLVAVLSSAFIDRTQWALGRPHVATLARTGRTRHLWSGSAEMDTLVEALHLLGFNATQTTDEGAPLSEFLREHYREASTGLAAALESLRALLLRDAAPIRDHARAVDASLFGAAHLVAPSARDLSGAAVEIDALRASLRAVAAADEALAGPAVPFAAFVARLERELDAPAVLLREPGGVLLAPLHTLHGLRFAYLAVAGLTEGEFPARRTTSTLLDVDARAELAAHGLALPPDSRSSEDDLWASAQSRADGTLSLWRSRLDDRGRPAPASYYYDEAATSLAAAGPASPREGAIEATRGWQSGVAQRPRGVEAWPVVRAAATVEQRRRSMFGAGAYEGDLPAVELASLTGPEVSWSATRLESYRTCGFVFFSRYALRLRELDAELDVADAVTRGTVIHAILDDAVRPLIENGRPLTDDTLEVALARLESHARTIWDQAPVTYGFGRAGLWRLEGDEALPAIARLLRTEAALGVGTTHIEGAELWGDATLALDPPLRIGSRLDRLDAGDDVAVVIDYKSGKYLDRRALERGDLLQLQLYAHLARARTGAQRVVARYAFLRQPTDWDLDTARPEDEALVAAAVTVAGEIRGDIESGDFRVLPSHGCPFWCSFQHICRRHESTPWKHWD